MPVEIRLTARAFLMGGGWPGKAGGRYGCSDGVLAVVGRTRYVRFLDASPSSANTKPGSAPADPGSSGTATPPWRRRYSASALRQMASTSAPGFFVTRVTTTEMRSPARKPGTIS